jgi:hypothetical protein
LGGDDAPASSLSSSSSSMAAAAAAAASTTYGSSGAHSTAMSQEGPLNIPVEVYDWLSDGPESRALDDQEHCVLECVPWGQWNALQQFYTTDFRPFTVELREKKKKEEEEEDAGEEMVSHDVLTLDESDLEGSSKKSVIASPSLYEIVLDERHCAKCFSEKQAEYLRNQKTYTNREVEIIFMKKGQSIPGGPAVAGANDADGGIVLDENGVPVKDQTTAKKLGVRRSSRACRGRAKAKVKVNSTDRVPKLLLLCLQAFNELDGIDLGRLQIYVHSQKRLRSDSTLGAEGVKAGSTLYMKVLKAGDPNIERELAFVFGFVFLFFLPKSTT